MLEAHEQRQPTSGMATTTITRRSRPSKRHNSTPPIASASVRRPHKIAEVHGVLPPPSDDPVDSPASWVTLGRVVDVVVAGAECPSKFAVTTSARRGAVAGVTRGQRQGVLARNRAEDGDVGRGHDLAVRDRVLEETLRREDVDVVAGGERIEVVERVGVGRAVSRDGDVARLSGQRRPLVMAGTLLELRLADALDDRIEDADLRDREEADGLAERGLRRRCRRLVRQRRQAEALRPGEIDRTRGQRVDAAASPARTSGATAPGPRRGRCPRAGRRRTRPGAGRCRRWPGRHVPQSSPPESPGQCRRALRAGGIGPVA